ncbi:uncharacterized protein TRUGW13939_08763 [Talaromyces rugulosus]|uniref:C2H2-type domain-containing protein n=1 Tax=Talaromyces rugulosus TaxID=121627 RepID=A0A7H8R788_TALRU|nr:uncharacterized protein TRUGW13939_08763 [Talaromyces rugulosus]QKX61611.1 hypothetical protein TRUGW13939_08763 [Talaromyces rugulosus]
MPLQKGFAAYWDRARETGADQNRQGIDGQVVRKRVVPSTTKAYDKVTTMFEDYCTKYGLQAAVAAYDMRTLKDFMNIVSWGIEGKYGDPTPGEQAIICKWNYLTANIRRKYGKDVPREATSSVTNTFVIPSIGAASRKRPKRQATTSRFVHLVATLWERDWHLYRQPQARVSLSAEILVYSSSSARIGEMIQSSSRPGTGKGVYFRDVVMVVFRNEEGMAEFAVRVVRPAKGQTYNPENNPEHAMHEGRGAKPFFLNPVLMFLALWIARGAFRDYSTVDQILDIPPPAQGRDAHVLHWRDGNLPLFPGVDQRIQKANAFDAHRYFLGKRAGFPYPPTIHEIRAEGVSLVDSMYSGSKRMKHAGHANPRIHNKFYEPNLATDLQSLQEGNDPRTLVNEVFRELSIPRHPDLAQELPAAEQYRLQQREDYRDIQRALADGQTGINRSRLYTKLRGLEKRALDVFQRSQQQAGPIEPGCEDDDGYSLGPQRSRYARACRLMPLRRRLAENIFKVGHLRSPLGRQVLADLIALAGQRHEIEIRTGLEADRCHCDVAHDSNDGASSSSGEESDDGWNSSVGDGSGDDGDAGCHGFGEFCFICDTWFTGRPQWEEHCRSHVGNPSTIPAQCNPLIYGATLVHPGFCPVCLGNGHFSQYLDRGSWKKHVDACFGVWVGSHRRPLSCPFPHPKCAALAVDPLTLVFHWWDIHVISIPRETVDKLQDVDLTVESIAPSRQRGFAFIDQTQFAKARVLAGDDGVRPGRSGKRGVPSIAEDVKTDRRRARDLSRGEASTDDCQPAKRLKTRKYPTIAVVIPWSPLWSSTRSTALSPGRLVDQRGSGHTPMTELNTQKSRNSRSACSFHLNHT